MADKLKKVFLYLLPCIFLMSHIIFNNNASAITPIIDITNSSVVYGVREVAVTCDYSDNTSASAYYCTGTNNKSVLSITPNIGTVSFKKGDVIDFYFGVTSPSFVSTFSNAGIGNVQTSSLYFQILNIEQVADSSIPQFVYDGVATLGNGSTVNYTYHITLSVVDDYTGNFTIQGSSRIPLLFFQGFSNSVNYIAFIHNFVVLRNNGGSSADQQNEINATNDSVQQSEDEGANSQSDTDNTTQSLMTAGANIISALTSAPATDCNINVSTTGSSAAFTSSIGSLNLCSDVPQGVLNVVQGMVALVFTPIVLYYVYSILTLIYAQFKEYNS